MLAQRLIDKLSQVFQACDVPNSGQHCVVNLLALGLTSVYPPSGCKTGKNSVKATSPACPHRLHLRAICWKTVPTGGIRAKGTRWGDCRQIKLSAICNG